MCIKFLNVSKLKKNAQAQGHKIVDPMERHILNLCWSKNSLNWVGPISLS
jgi:hypothetical protein